MPGTGGVTEEVGVCRLCENERSLRISHFHPAALYAKRYELATQTSTAFNAEQVKQRLLCQSCEGRFNAKGENGVLRWLAPKTTKFYPLLERMNSTPREYLGHKLWSYSGVELGINNDEFSYFALSMVWRGAAASWPLPNGKRTTLLLIGRHQEELRQYLLGQSGFPRDAAVIATVCTDDFSQRSFLPPELQAADDCLTFPFLVRGLIFRVWLGDRIPTRIRSLCCYRSDRRVILSTDAEDETRRQFSTLPMSLNI